MENSNQNPSNQNPSNQNENPNPFQHLEASYENDIHKIIQSQNVKEQDYNFDIEDGKIILTLENNGNIASHLDVIQNIISFLYSQQQQHNHPNSGQFSVIPMNNSNLPTMNFSFEEGDDEEEEYYQDENKYDYFLNCKFINKYIGKPEKIKKNDPLLCNDSECFICFEKYKTGELKRTLKCNHTFHKKCVDKWLKKKSTCPHCRCNLMDHIHLSNEDIEEYICKEHKICGNHPNISFHQGMIHIEFTSIQENINNNYQEEENIILQNNLFIENEEKETKEE